MPSINDDRRSAIDPDDAAIVARIFKDYAAGEGISSICSTLNAEGVPVAAFLRRRTTAFDRSRQ